MNSFITTILVLLLLYFGLKFIFRWARPYIMRFLAKKMAEKFGQAPNPFESYQKKPEGEVTIDKNPPKSSKNSKVVGEYIEYEEID